MSKNNKIIVKKHMIFGKIRFAEGKPYLIDVAKSLNYKDGTYVNIVRDYIDISEDNFNLLQDEGIRILIDNSNIEIPTLYKQWMFEFALPSVRRTNTDLEILPIKRSDEIETIALNNKFKSIVNLIKTSDNLITIPVHGFSNNHMYKFSYTGKVTKSDAYKKWRKEFPTEYLDKLSYIDFSKPIQAYYIFDHLEAFDTPNFSKSLSDIIADYFNVDDHQIINQISIQGEIVNSFKEGKIHIFLYNI